MCFMINFVCFIYPPHPSAKGAHLPLKGKALFLFINILKECKKKLKSVIIIKLLFSVLLRRISMEKEILIEGMSCSHCSESVKKALSKVSGVSEVIVDLDKKIAVVDVDNVDDDVLSDAVSNAGFEAINITEH